MTTKRIRVLAKCLIILFLMVAPHSAIGQANNLEPSEQELRETTANENPGSAKKTDQPDQMWSKVYYDPKLTDTFFRSNEWSYPYGGQDIVDGMWDGDPPRLKHTAKCFSSSFGAREHVVRFCEAILLDGNMIDLFIHDTTKPAYFDKLDIQIRNGMFTCHYSTVYEGDPRDIGLIWTTKWQELTLDKKVYRKGDVIKGRINFECVQEINNPEYIKKWGTNPTTIKIHGVFKTKAK